MWLQSLVRYLLMLVKENDMGGLAGFQVGNEESVWKLSSLARWHDALSAELVIKIAVAPLCVLDILYCQTDTMECSNLQL